MKTYVFLILSYLDFQNLFYMFPFIYPLTVIQKKYTFEVSNDTSAGGVI